MNATQTIVGHDNTDGKNFAVILETTEGSEYVFCEEYDWAHGVTTSQAETLITGTITEKKDVMVVVTGDGVDGWYNAVKDVDDVR